jgi:hypothetical protein
LSSRLSWRLWYARLRRVPRRSQTVIELAETHALAAIKPDPPVVAPDVPFVNNPDFNAPPLKLEGPIIGGRTGQAVKAA